jgi:hypothetical protein
VCLCDHKAIRRTVPFVINSGCSILSCLSCENVNEIAYSGCLQIKLSYLIYSLYSKLETETFDVMAKFRMTTKKFQDAGLSQKFLEIAQKIHENSRCIFVSCFRIRLTAVAI